MDTKLKNRSARAALAFLCFFISVSILFVTGLRLLERRTNDSYHYVLSEAFIPDIRDTAAFRAEVANRFRSMLDQPPTRDVNQEFNYVYQELNQDAANVRYEFYNGKTGFSLGNSDYDMLSGEVPPDFQYVFRYAYGNISVTENGKDITSLFTSYWPIGDMFYQQTGQSYSSYYGEYEYSDSQTIFDKNPNWENYHIVMAFSDKLVPTDSSWSLYSLVQNRQQNILGFMISLAAAVILFVIYFLLRKDKAYVDQKIARFSGRVFVEIKVILLAFLLPASLMTMGRLYYFTVNKAIALLLVFYFVYLVINDLRYNKTAVFRQNIFLTAAAWHRKREQYKPFQKKMVDRFWVLLGLELFLLFTGFLLFFLSFSPYSFAFVIVVLLWLAAAVAAILLYMRRFRKTVDDIGSVVDQIGVIKSGDMEARLVLSVESDMAGAAQELNEIQEGFSKALEERIRSERMKVELITNVSHDIKTPLTSIIGYVDLLEKEEDLPDHVKDYIHVLSKKSQRLKNMVQDIFDVSKATSGNMKLELEDLDLVKLIRQTMADMSEEIDAADLTFKTNLPDAPVHIKGDGQRLYRVFQNLFKNALQYSLDGSRVFISLFVSGSWTTVTIKNTSRFELDDIGDNITERFVRGDASRTTEGSGLGLSIAQSFTEACGGSFRVVTDADLFCVEISFPVLAIEPTQAPPLSEGQASSDSAQ